MIPNSLPIAATQQMNDKNYDAYVYVATNLEIDINVSSTHFVDLINLKKVNENFENEVSLINVNNKRVIYSATGPLNRDYDDVRRIKEAVFNGIKKALKSGSKSPLLILKANSEFPKATEVSLLAALEATYIPLEVREANKSSELLKVTKLGLWSSNVQEAEQIIQFVSAIELGRIITRDIGGSDPERMSAPNVAAYVHNEFAAHSDTVTVSVLDKREQIAEQYPLFAAVDRAANQVARHRGRIVKLEYSSKDAPIDTTVFLVGKGITYDTGGADIKAGGHMSGMHRDKCGAAFVAGFFKTLALLKPKGLKVFGTLCLARNSVGEESYVSDEIITARSGKRVRIGNTDAEGRMVMADPLCEAKEQAANEINPQLFTIATLTGHVIRAYGPNYTAVLGNGPSVKLHIDRALQSAGDLLADPYEISTIRCEDYAYVAGRNEYEDLLQASNNPSVNDSRGHIFPAAFLIGASGLDKHGIDSTKKLPYTHLDIAGSSGPYPGIPTGSPLPSFAQHFIASRI